MKGYSYALAFLLFSVCRPPIAMADPIARGYTRLTFADEFNGATLDTRKWIDSYPDGVRTHGFNEQQYYATDGYYLRGGTLVLRAEQRPNGGQPYTSGMVASYSKFSQQYGWFEIRCKVPKGKGYWPAFWLLPANKKWPPEFDILELIGSNTNETVPNYHYRDAAGALRSHRGSYWGEDFSENFHTFALEWKPAVAIWYVDGIEIFRVTEDLPHQPMYVIANLAVGSSSAWSGVPDSTTPWPGLLLVDYIRVYQSPALEQ